MVHIKTSLMMPITLLFLSFLIVVGCSAADADEEEWEQLSILGRGIIADLAYSPDGQTLAVGGSVGVWLYQSDNLDAPPRLLDAVFIESVSWSPDGSMLAGGSRDGPVIVWDVASGEEFSVLEGGAHIYCGGHELVA